MNRFPLVGVVVAGLVLVGLVGVGAYAAGSHWHHDGSQVIQVVDSSGQPATGTAPVVHVVERRGRHWGFFPGFIFLPLLFFGLFWLVVGGFGRRHRWYGRSWAGGPGSFEEWHRHQHDSQTGASNDNKPTP